MHHTLMAALLTAHVHYPHFCSSLSGMWLCPFDPPTQTVIVVPTPQVNEWENADEWWFGHDWHRAPRIPPWANRAVSIR